MTTRDEVIKAAKSAKLSRFMFDTDRCKDDLERFYTIAFKAGMERAAGIVSEYAYTHTDGAGAFNAADAIREEVKK